MAQTLEQELVGLGPEVTSREVENFLWPEQTATAAEDFLRRAAVESAINMELPLPDLEAQFTVMRSTEDILGSMMATSQLASSASFIGVLSTMSRNARGWPFGIGRLASPLFSYVGRLMHPNVHQAFDLKRRHMTRYARAHHALTSISIQELGLVSGSYLRSFVGKTTAPLIRLPYDIQALGNRLHAALSQALADLYAKSHRAFQEIAQLRAQVHEIFNQLAHIWARLHYHQREITQLQYEVRTLTKEIVKLNTEVKTLTKMEHATQTRLLHNEALTEPGLAAAAVMTLLAPLVATGLPGITNLSNMARNPCHCFTIPGGQGALLWLLVMNLYAEHGP